MIYLLLLVLWAVAETLVAIRVADAIGALLTVLVLVAGWPIGSYLVRAEGRAAFRRFREAVGAGREPGAEAADGALAMAGGALLILPGFITDLVGLCLLVAPVRRLLSARLVRNFRGRMAVAVSGAGRRAPRSYDVDSTAHDTDGPQLPR